MPKRSAGILAYKQTDLGLAVFLVHPGGPYWARKDLGFWSVPKGEYGDGEDPLAAAKREFQEETGFTATGDFLDLGEVRQPGGKVVKAWAIEADFDPTTLKSNTFKMEWPPKSGKIHDFPEVDRGDWFTVYRARKAMLEGQQPFIERLIAHLGEK